MAKYETTLTGQFETVLNRLQEDIEASGISMRLVDQSYYCIGDMNIAVRVYDKYFMRNSSRASLSLTVVGKGNELYVSAIGAGGGQGALLNFSWGAEEDLVAVVQESIERLR